jgi:hypothetical protein
MVWTDHYSVKFLLDQRLATIPQHHWVGKLLGYDFTVEYKPGALNTVAYALSRRDTEEDITNGAVLAVSTPRFDFIARLHNVQATDPTLVAIREELADGSRSAPWALIDDLLTYEGRLYMPLASPLQQELLAAIHEDGHEGVRRTIHRLR